MRARPHLVWVYSDSLQSSLDAATWLETTQELRKLGWEVTLVSAGPAGPQRVRDVNVLCFHKPNIYLVRQLVFHAQVLWFVLRRWSKIEVILFHQMSAPWLLPLRLLRSLNGGRTPLIVMDTRTVPMIPTRLAAPKDRLRNAYDNWMNRLANSLADGQTAITYRMAEVVGIPKDKLLGVWPSGVKQDRFVQKSLLRQWPSPNEDVHLIYIGAVQLERHLVQFTDAVQAANNAGMAFRFTIVGTGSAQSALAKKAQQSNGRIRMLPPVDHEEVPLHLARAHIGILPFPDEERFQVSSPIKLFEYMASGLAVLATRIACHTDVIGDSPIVFWAEDASVQGLYDALELLWRQRDTLPAKGHVAMEASDNWTWESSAQKLSQSLENGLTEANAASGLPQHESGEAGTSSG